MIREYNGNDFDNLIKNKILVDFYANWCGPCKMLSKVIDEISEDINIDILKIDIDKFGGIAKRYGVMSIPTIILFDNNIEIKKNIGLINKEELLYFISGEE